MSHPQSNMLVAHSIDDLPQIGRQLINAIPTQKIILFHGEMGAGKTTLIKALCKELGVTDNVTSPTFSIVNEYSIPAEKIYHFDFYRIKNQTEAMDMGCEEYFYSGDYCLIEWPEMIPGLIPARHANIYLTVTADNKREIRIS